MAASTVVATADPNDHKCLTPWPHDPARARAQLAEAGWVQIPLYSEALIYNSPTWMTGFTPARSVSQSTLWIEYWKPR